MPRPRRCRKVRFQPNIIYFKPVGVPIVDLEESILTIDELESIRLKDLENLDQDSAAKKMNISQSTFHRLIISAREKIADALINGKSIKIEGGTFKIVKPRKGYGFTHCICSKCNHKEEKERGFPCIRKKCSKCGSPMIGGN